MAQQPGHQRLPSAVLLVAGLALVVFGLTRISFEVDILKLLPGDLKEVRGLGLFLEHFSRPGELIVTLDGEDSDAVDEAGKTLAEALRSQPGLVEAVIDHAPWEDDPGGLAELVAFALLNQPRERFAELEKKLAPGASVKQLEATLEEMAYAISPAMAVLGGYDPFGLVPAAMGESGFTGMMPPGGSEFVSEDGTLRILYVRASGGRDRSNYRDLIEWIGRMRSLVSEWKEAHPEARDVVVRFTGEPAFVAEISGGMERDMRTTGLATMIVIGLVFWLWYRRLRPLAMLAAALMATFVITLGLAGIVIRDLTVINVGFASILIGLSVDYGVLIYQATLRRPGDAAAVRQESRRGILCAGATTAVAFGSLAVSSLPGLSELGILVAIGIAVGAALMLLVFADGMGRISRSWTAAGPDEPVSLPERWIFGPRVSNGLAWGVLGLVALAAFILMVKGPPQLDASSRTLRPRVSEAHNALDAIVARLLHGEEMGSLVVRGKTGAEVRDRLIELQPALEAAVEDGRLARFVLPAAFVPVKENQQTNLEGGTRRLAGAGERLLGEMREAGFAEEGELLFRQVLDFWAQWRSADGVVLPKSEGARWIVDRMVEVAADRGEIFAACQLVPAAGADLRSLAAGEEVYVADWNQTMLGVLERIPSEILRAMGVLAALVIAMLWITFRRVVEIAWVFLAIALSVTSLLGVMRLLGWHWNFFNLASLLLTFGAGLDYSIHMLLGFRRGESDVRRVQRDVGQALLVCALSTVAGFGSLSWANNLGLASLGRICALGMFLNALVAVFLLPRLWLWWAPRR